MATEQLQIRRGDDWPIDIEISDPDGGAIDFSGAVLTVALSRRNEMESRLTPLLALTSPARLTITTLTDGTRITGEFTAAETAALTAGYLYFWLVSVSGSDTVTWIREAINIS